LVSRLKCLLKISLIGLVLGACQPPQNNREGPPDFTPSEKLIIQSLTGHPELTSNPSNRWADQPRAAHFGQYLFFDKRLSQNGKLNCASCHNPGLGWSDGKALAQGLKTTARNSPSLWNVSHQRWFFWDGRTDSAWAQAIQPLESLAEMGMDRVRLLHVFHQNSDLRQGYEALFGTLPSVTGLPSSGRPVAEQADHPLQKNWNLLSEAQKQQVNIFLTNLTKTLEAFERRFQTGENAFDRFAKGLRTHQPELQNALSIEAQKGLRLFIGRAQCVLCHTGPLFSDLEFHNTGLSALPGQAIDQGRYLGIPALMSDAFNGLGPYTDLASKEDAWNDKLIYLQRKATNQGEFKTPGLREISRTAPYMHDGRFKTLEEVVRFYSQPLSEPPATGRREDTIQVLDLKPEEIKYLVAFLESLTGPEPPLDWVGQPKSAVYSQP